MAQFKFTVLLMPNGPHKITGINFDPETCDSDKKIDDLDIQVSCKDLMELRLQGILLLEIKYLSPWLL